MKYILNYRTQQEVENVEDVLSVSGEIAGSDWDVPYETDTITEISGTTYGYVKYGQGEEMLIDLTNLVGVLDSWEGEIIYFYTQQPVTYYDEQGFDHYDVFFKFEQTSDTPVKVYYNGGTASRNALEGRIAFSDGSSYERVFSVLEGDTRIGFFLYDHDASDGVYSNPNWWMETRKVSPVVEKKWKINSVTPGAGYCKENRNVMYNDPWKYVTIYTDNMEKTYRKNYITLEELRSDFNKPDYYYVYMDDNNVCAVGDGYMFLKGSNKKRYYFGPVD